MHTLRKKAVSVAVVALLTYVALIGIRDLRKLFNTEYMYAGTGYDGYGLTNVVFAAVIVWLLWKIAKERRLRYIITSSICGILLSFVTVAGTYLLYMGDLFADHINGLKVFALILCISVITIPLSHLILVGMDRISELLNISNASNTADNSKADKTADASKADEPNTSKTDKTADNSKATEKVKAPKNQDATWTKRFAKIKKVFEKPAATFGLYTAILMLCWLPMFLSNWPVNFIADAAYQMINYTDDYITTHHPILHTLMLGKAYDIGVAMGNPSAGFAIYTAVQMLIMAMAIAYFMTFLKTSKAPNVLRIASALFFLVVPVFRLMAISTTKDGLSGAFLLICLTAVAKLMRSPKVKWYEFAVPVFSGVLACTFRNNMIYAIVAGGLIALLIVGNMKRRIAAVLLVASIFIVNLCVGKILFAATDAHEIDTRKESMSVPLQCLARVAALHRDEMPEELYEEFEQYVPAEAIVSYMGFNADNVKNNANEDLLRSNTFNFLKLWLKVGFKFPGEYVEAIGLLTHGYLYPANTAIGTATDIPLYTMNYSNIEPIDKKDLAPWYTKLFGKLYSQDTKYEIVLWGIWFRPILYVWGLLFVTAWELMHIKEKKKAFVVTLVPLMYFATCMLGPTVFLRYVFPVIITLPLIACAAFGNRNFLEVQQ